MKPVVRIRTTLVHAPPTVSNISGRIHTPAIAAGTHSRSSSGTAVAMISAGANGWLVI